MTIDEMLEWCERDPLDFLRFHLLKRLEADLNVAMRAYDSGNVGLAFLGILDLYFVAVSALTFMKSLHPSLSITSKEVIRHTHADFVKALEKEGVSYV